jgi:hypothetical protein
VDQRVGHILQPATIGDFRTGSIAPVPRCPLYATFLPRTDV